MQNNLKDEEFTRELKRLRKRKRIARIISLTLILGGIIMLFVLYQLYFDTLTGFIMILAGLLFWGISAIYMSGDRETAIKKFIADYKEKTEYESFGSNMESPGWEITKEYLLNNNISQKEWDEFKAADRYEGYWNGIHFMAANLTLTGKMRPLDAADENAPSSGRTDMFSGILISVETKVSAKSPFLITFPKYGGGAANPIALNELSKRCIVRSDDPDYARTFIDTYAACIHRLYNEYKYSPHIYFGGDRLQIGIQLLGDKFRAVNGRPDINNPDSFRDSFNDSLKYVTRALDIIKEETDLV